MKPNIRIGGKKPTAVGAGRSAVAVHVASRRWFSFLQDHIRTMRNSNFIILASLLFLVGCAKQHDQAGYWSGRSVLPNRGSVAMLNVSANSPSLIQEKRAHAIYTLFAYHVRPGFSAADMHTVLKDTSWLKTANLTRLELLAGWIPVNSGSDRTLFDLHLFYTQKDDADNNWWCIEFSLSGPNRSLADAVDFLNGNTELIANPKLEEFALMFPPPKTGFSRSPGGRRMEVYSKEGIHVYP